MTAKVRADQKLSSQSLKKRIAALQRLVGFWKYRTKRAEELLALRTARLQELERAT